jgi:predicted dinucleotide-binding enzyme
MPQRECGGVRCVATDMTTVGIIGAGHIGSTLAKGLVDRGYDVVIANSRGPETLSDLVAELGHRATAATPAEAAAAAEWAIVTVPLAAIETLPVEELAGKIVVDTNNYYWERDGRIAELEENRTTTSEMLQRKLPASVVVKGFNHIMSVDILTDGSPAGTPGRRALATAADDPKALALITDLYDQFGYDTVSAGPLSESWRVERDRPAYVVRQDAAELEQNLARAVR